MKSMKFVGFIAMVLSCSSASLYAAEGGYSGGGGGIFALEFTQFARGALALLKTSNQCRIPELDLTKLENAIDTTRVVAVEKTFLDDKEVDAVNHPDQHLIELNFTRLNTIRTDQSTLMTFALHEYFSMIDLDDSHYKVSSKLFLCMMKDVRLAVNEYSPQIGLVSLQSYTLEDLRLGQAILNGDVNKVEQALNEGASANSLFQIIATEQGKDHQHFFVPQFTLSALSLAAVQNNSQMIRLLVDRGAEINGVDDLNQMKYTPSLHSSFTSPPATFRFSCAHDAHL
ncbi:hypothetical protein WDW86_03095 [Bdellovibrionota bacterium FG-2]